MPRSLYTRRSAVFLAGSAAAVAGAGLAGCAQPARNLSTTASGGATTTSGPASVTPTTPTPTPEPKVAFKLNIDPAAAVPVDTRLVVSPEAGTGTVTQVALSYTDPKNGAQTVSGKLAADGSAWTADSLLEPNVSYKLDVTGNNVKGTANTQSYSFSSQKLTLKQQIFATIATGGTVGVAAPVIVRFDVPVTDKANFQKYMKVTSTPAQNGSWYWMSSTEAHWRPENYWQPGTKVSINLDINSIPAGNGTFGQKSVSGSMTVSSRSLVLKADLASHQMAVVVNGATVKTIPITGGKTGFLTRSGNKVIMEKFDKLKMDANTVGIEPGDPEYYNIPDVQYAMRETNSGEFVHAAPWSVGSQGTANVSHGCIGVSTDNGAWLFNNVIVGDPIVVSGTTRSLEWGNGWTDWNISFEQYKKGVGTLSTEQSGGVYSQAGQEFTRDTRYITTRIMRDPGEGDYPVEAGRYRLVAARACPWANRTIIVRRLLGLEDAISLGLAGPVHDADSWTFDLDPGGVDPVLGIHKLKDAYEKRFPGYPRGITVPAIVDERTGEVVTNDFAQITLDFSTEWTQFHRPGAPDLYPEAMRDEMDQVMRRVYTEVNNGVYRCGFAGSQESYDAAYERLFVALDWLSDRLAGQRYLMGDSITEADVRLFTTLVRFDPVYHGHFKCNRSKLSEMDVLWAYARDLYQTPGFGDTIDFEQIKQHYYRVHTDLNPHGIVPLGPDLSGWLTPHGRDELGGRPFGDGTPPSAVRDAERPPFAVGV